MSILVTAERVGTYTVKYTWSGTAPYDVWMNGEKILDQTSVEEYIAQYAGSDVPYAIEVTDADDVTDADSLRFSPRLRLQWRGQADAYFYRIQRYNGSSWITKQIAEERGRGYYQFITPQETDGASVQWRVLAEDDQGNQSDAEQFTWSVVCNPDPPNVVGNWDEGSGELVISAA